jgi:hypothetical protein
LGNSRSPNREAFNLHQCETSLAILDVDLLIVTLQALLAPFDRVAFFEIARNCKTHLLHTQQKLSVSHLTVVSPSLEMAFNSRLRRRNSNYQNGMPGWRLRTLDSPWSRDDTPSLRSWSHVATLNLALALGYRESKEFRR